MTWGHLGRRRAYLPSRFEFRDAEGRVGCGIAGSTSLCRKMGKEVSETKKKELISLGIEPRSPRPQRGILTTKLWRLLRRVLQRIADSLRPSVGDPPDRWEQRDVY